jgi:hypothetical protein
MAKEASAKAAREALEAAAEAAAAVEREVLDVAPIEVEHTPPSTIAGICAEIYKLSIW